MIPAVDDYIIRGMSGHVCDKIWGILSTMDSNLQCYIYFWEICSPFIKSTFTNNLPNHPPNIPKNIPLEVNWRLCRLSNSKEEFLAVVNPYQEALDTVPMDRVDCGHGDWRGQYYQLSKYAQPLSTKRLLPCFTIGI